jgi:hypothetical protein
VAEHHSKKNPVAKDLRTPKYRPRVTRDRTKYTRKQKHKEKSDE